MSAKRGDAGWCPHWISACKCGAIISQCLCAKRQKPRTVICVACSKCRERSRVDGHTGYES